MGLISSLIALDLLLALTQRREGARLPDLAAAAATSLSAAQVAAKLLVPEGLVTREAARRPRYRLRRDHPLADSLLMLAARSRPIDRVLATLLRANPAIEFAARDRIGLLVVESPVADPRDVILLDAAVHMVTRGLGAPPVLTRFDHHALVDKLREDSGPRQRARRAAILKGSLERSFPSPRRRGDRARSFPRPSRRAIAALARKHGLKRLRIFGSAARGMLREGSDVDVVVEPRSGHALSLLDLVQIEAALEGLFDRHVDVSMEGGLRPEVRRRIAQEAITVA
jgi:predicted nucleotidyltransferase